MTVAQVRVALAAYDAAPVDMAVPEAEALADAVRALLDVDEFQPTQWWRVIYADGSVYADHYPPPAGMPEAVGAPHELAGQPRIWCEARDEFEVRSALSSCPGGGILQRLYERPATRRWEDEQ